MNKNYQKEFTKVSKVVEIFEIKHPEYQKEIIHLKTHNFNVRSIEVGKQRTNFGLCRMKKDYFGFNHKAAYGAYITFNKRLLDKGREKKLENTIIHEILHAVADNLNGMGQGHKGFWKELANIYNSLFPNDLPMKRCGNWDDVPNKEKTKERKIEDYKYVVRCEDECEFEKYYKRKGKVIKSIENYRCPHCGAPLYVKELR